jgi:hypothetical protein
MAEQTIKARVTFQRNHTVSETIEITKEEYEKLKKVSDDIYDHTETYFILDNNMETHSGESNNVLENFEITLVDENGQVIAEQ